MQRIEGVMYDERPQAVTVYPTSVIVLVDCEEVQVEDEMSGKTSTKYKCTTDVYGTSEYIDVLQKTNDELNNKVVQNQLGLVEVYEMLL